MGKCDHFNSSFKTGHYRCMRVGGGGGGGGGAHGDSCCLSRITVGFTTDLYVSETQKPVQLP